MARKAKRKGRHTPKQKRQIEAIKRACAKAGKFGKKRCARIAFGTVANIKAGRKPRRRRRRKRKR